MSLPSGRALLREHLYLPTASVHEVRRWSNRWKIDPFYGVRFRADPAALRDACEVAGAGDHFALFRRGERGAGYQCRRDVARDERSVR
ncbi:MAG: hypothetical protein GX547_05870 [Phycisphaerae bacterium]|nr:hypothetical protein [Phycisphaerae bacterium]